MNLVINRTYKHRLLLDKNVIIVELFQKEMWGLNKKEMVDCVRFSRIWNNKEGTNIEIGSKLRELSSDSSTQDMFNDTYIDIETHRDEILNKLGIKD